MCPDNMSGLGNWSGSWPCLMGWSPQCCLHCLLTESSICTVVALLGSVQVIKCFPEAAGWTDMADNTIHATSVPCARLISHHSNTSCQPVTGTACCITFMKTILAHWQHHSHESHPTHREGPLLLSQHPVLCAALDNRCQVSVVEDMCFAACSHHIL